MNGHGRMGPHEATCTICGCVCWYSTDLDAYTCGGCGQWYEVPAPPRPTAVDDAPA